MEERIIAALKQLGFTTTAARAYLALLKNHPATGYELASRSKVPRSAIYNVLGRLESLGLVNAVQDKPAKYVPLAPERLFELLATRFEKSLGELEVSLESLGGGTPETITWTLQGYGNLLDRAAALIVGSEKSLYASLWLREANALAEPLRRAKAAGVDVVLFSFNALPEDLGELYCYGIPEAELEGHWEHKVILVSDQRRCLVGGAAQTEENRTVITEEAALVEMAISNLVLDVTLAGERLGTDTAEVVARLAVDLAPLDELLARQGKNRP